LKTLSWDRLNYINIKVTFYNEVLFVNINLQEIKMSNTVVTLIFVNVS